MNTDPNTALDLILAEAMSTVKTEGGEHGVYLAELADVVRNQLTNPTPPKGTLLIGRSELSLALNCLERDCENGNVTRGEIKQEVLNSINSLNS